MGGRIVRGLVTSAIVAAATTWLAPIGMAGPAFDAIQPEIFGSRPIHDGRAHVRLKAPYRPDDVRAVPIEVEALFGDGRTVKAVTLIVDNNPSPVVAAFRFVEARPSAKLGISFRLNQQSDVRAVVEASDGRLYMTSQLVKFAGGQAACSAPPSASPAEIARTLGRMSLTEVAVGWVTTSTPRMRLELSHPNHTGMALDQQTLLYTPLRMVDRIAVRQGGQAVFVMEGSIGLKENPMIEFEVARSGTVEVEATDTDGATFHSVFPLGADG